MDCEEAALVPSYLDRILRAAKKLSTLRRHDEDVENETCTTPLESSTPPSLSQQHTTEHGSGEAYLENIAEYLLLSCRLEHIVWDSSHSPPRPATTAACDYAMDRFVPINKEFLHTIRPRPPECRILATEPYAYRRIDSLRLLLRAMAPIAMDVAAHVCSILLTSATTFQSTSTSTTSTTIDEEENGIPGQVTVAATILFGVWLPIAPHLCALTTQLFAHPRFSCPLSYAHRTFHPNHPNHDSSVHMVAAQWLEVAHALHSITRFYADRREQSSLGSFAQWDWSLLSTWSSQSLSLSPLDEEQEEEEDGSQPSFRLLLPIRWHAVRALGYRLSLAPCRKADYYKAYGVSDEQVPWMMHPWEWEHEASTFAALFLQGKTMLWRWWTTSSSSSSSNDDDDDEDEDEVFDCPRADQIRSWLPLHPFLVDFCPGLTFCRHDLFLSRDTRFMMKEEDDDVDLGLISSAYPRVCVSTTSRLIRTSTTMSNMTAIGMALIEQPYPPPILLCGPSGSGKSSLVRELARLVVTGSGENHHHHHDQAQALAPDGGLLLELHVDDETDTKTLVGSYTAADKWGEFEWRPGALTLAVRQGRWVLLENVDKVPVEIHAALTQLFEDRLLSLGNGHVEVCHPNFRIFGTISVDASIPSASIEESVTRRFHQADVWQCIHVQPLPMTEIREIVVSQYSTIPASIMDATLSIFAVVIPQLSTLSAHDSKHPLSKIAKSEPQQQWVSRNLTIRDMFKVFSRISAIPFETNAVFTTEQQRTLCLLEIADVVLGACPSARLRRTFVQTIAAPRLELAGEEVALPALETRAPAIHIHETCTDIGRVRMYHPHRSPPSLRNNVRQQSSSDSFTATSFTLRLLESIGVCVRENEPVLLVGETGCGKTTILQELARLSGRELVVQNLSLQTDSTDLLGGYRPLEIKNVAKTVYQDFIDLFTSTFSRKQNYQFLEYSDKMLRKKQWTKLSQCFRKAAEMGLTKLRELRQDIKHAAHASIDDWQRFRNDADRFEQQRVACASGMAFAFSEGALVDAVRKGKWVLLDEINLASSETLQRLYGLLDDSTSSITLTERGDTLAIQRNSEFRLFAAMNPATDAGKKELSAVVRSRFTELYVDELLDPKELRDIVHRYLRDILPASDRNPEHTELVNGLVDVYLKCRELTDTDVVDGAGKRPRYSLRTLTRALAAAKKLKMDQNIPLMRSLLEGFELAFQGSLDDASAKIVSKAFMLGFKNRMNQNDRDCPGRRSGKLDAANSFVLIKPFRIRTGPTTQIDWSLSSDPAIPKFILTQTTIKNLRRLARAIVSGPWPILLEGPTGTGKTNLIQYIAALSGNTVIRINNHEHTDIQEYTGGYASDASGTLVFQDGLLVHALRRGHWVILDELNLAPSDVLEALNRLLDDNRELYLSETNEVIKPHHNFRLFATQNPCGVYGGRKLLSRAFRNRFIELHIGNLPALETVEILEKRCACPPSHANMLVSIMVSLRRRGSRTGLFLGKDEIITPRDLLRWAHRGVCSKQDLARAGYMLLAERLRTKVEQEIVKEEIETHVGVNIDIDDLYYGSASTSRKLLNSSSVKDSPMKTIAPTKSFLRLISLVTRCIEQHEPVLLVGDTGNGKTSVVQLLAFLYKSRLRVVNCHATTETSDLLGGLRPLRNRSALAESIKSKCEEFCSLIEQHSLYKEKPTSLDLPSLVNHAKLLWESFVSKKEEQRISKRLKRETISRPETDFEVSMDATLLSLYEEIVGLHQRYSSLFEWVDGPLVEAMKDGSFILLDEMSLADDAVLERLNSVLEPSRTVVLAEKGTAGELDIAPIKAREGFQLFATMNPGGDFGKRELSPALRNRFTEIWVPPILDPDDISIVLDRYLTPFSATEVKIKMMAYLEWFNNNICCNPQNPHYELSLSLRDVLSWAHFIIEATKSGAVSLWEAYRQGVFLVHLDGIGLGTGIDRGRVDELRRIAESFLTKQLSLSVAANSLTGEVTVPFRNIEGMFGKPPFWIEVGTAICFEPSFQFESPTTSSNLFRVLRAMQLSKPILLEGEPGAGKTSLISSLAAVSGHHLVRINLSEQSDISDLFGSDLPVAGDTSQSQGPFQWCDGVLLSAIKSGSWVLLDEMNLAPQTVLEGLNSCLDHRSSVFIPEIGRSFDCPASFRVFAAQNPVAQGGGRKGLPKSFLNRFTKVHIEQLIPSDFKSIVSSRFPQLSPTLTATMIEFNGKIQQCTEERMELGKFGGPWEFNLRDIIRWCELFDLRQALENISSFYARDLYVQRFRSNEDRNFVASVYRETFTDPILSSGSCSINVCPSTVMVGDITLPRILGASRPLYAYPFSEPNQFLSVTESFEASARCLSMRWPCLLIGSSRDKISSIVHGLAVNVGAKVVELSLSASSDVSELIGCFEQVDSSAKCRSLIQLLVTMAVEYSLRLSDTRIDEVLKYVFHLSQTMNGKLNDSVSHALELAALLSRKNSSFLDDGWARTLNDCIVGLRNHNDHPSTSDASSNCMFVWKDGPLVNAMLNGSWIHLRNANLCPATVLDRLNSVLEPDGSLLIAECGNATEDIINVENVHREVIPDQNFAVFLSMDPRNGEISRAMRNRCVEIFVQDQDQQVTLVNRFLRQSSSMCRGVAHKRVLLADEQQMNVDTFSNESTKHTQYRNDMLTSPIQARIFRESMIFKPLIYRIESLNLPKLLDLNIDTTKGSQIRLLRNVLLNRFLLRCESCDFYLRSSFLARIPKSAGATLQYLAESLINRSSSKSRCRGPFNNVKLGVIDQFYFSWIISRRGVQVVEEASWLQSGPHESNRPVSVLRMSQNVYSATAVTSHVTCPVTPTLLPLLLIFDKVFSTVIDSFHEIGSVNKSIGDLVDLLYKRDELWNLLTDLTFSVHSTRIFQFDETEFIVLWTWFRQCLANLDKLDICPADPGLNRKLKDLVMTVDLSIFGVDGAQAGIRRMILSGLTKPLSPRTAGNWSVILSTSEFVDCFSLPERIQVAAGTKVTNQIELIDLVNRSSPLLYAARQLKREITAGASMARLSSLSEKIGHACNTLPQLDLRVSALFRNELLMKSKSFEEKLGKFRLALNAGEDWGDENEPYPDNDFALAYQQTLEELLSRFARLQLSPLAECYCEHMERLLSELLCGWLLGVVTSEDLQRLVSTPSISRFVDLMFTHSQWTPRETSPYEILTWLGDVSDDLDPEIVRSLVPLITANAKMHAWHSSRRLGKCISPKLELSNSCEQRCGRGKQIHNESAFSNKFLPFQTVFMMVGNEFQPRHVSVNASIFVTVENYPSREQQSKDLVELLALTEECSASDPTGIHELSYKLYELLLAIGFKCPDGKRFVDLLLAPDATEPPHVVMETISDVFVKLQVPEVIFLSAWRYLHCAWLQHCSQNKDIPLQLENISFAQAYLGLLRFHLLLPDSPVDPGNRPAAEIRLFDRRLSRLKIEAGAMSLEKKFIRGNADTAEELEILQSEIQQLFDVRSRQESKIVRRPEGCPLFADLYKETRDFAKRFMDADSMIRFYHDLSDRFGRSSSSDSVGLMQRVLSWKATAESFCNRLITLYATYEDIVLPLVDAIGSIYLGISDIIQECVITESPPEAVNEIEVFLQYPLALGNPERLIAAMNVLTNLGCGCEVDLCFAVLSKLTLSRYAVGMDSPLLLAWNDIVDKLISIEASSHQATKKSLTVDNILELQYREQFPDYRRDFDVVSMSPIDEALSYESIDPTTNDNNIGLLDNCFLRDDQVELLHWMHECFFSEETEDISCLNRNLIRKRAFEISYSLSFRIFDSGIEHLSFARPPSLSGHALAMAMCAIEKPKSPFCWNLVTSKSGFDDFNLDPSPSQVSRVKIPLEQLSARVIQLLNMFPDNSILAAIAKVTERVRRLNLLFSSLRQAMVGLEVILKHAQDWEQHASVRFKIGSPLALISNLVKKWRKLELDSWLDLLRAREIRREKQSRRHWFRLYIAIMAASSRTVSNDVPKPSHHARCYVPPWIWKGLSFLCPKITVDINLRSADMEQVLKVVDTFILTSSIVEFEFRLNMVKTFAKQLEYENQIFNFSMPHTSLLMARALQSIWFYYRQFSRLIAEHLTEIRKPFEKKLAEQVKLAKWDEQTYYSLAESTERNHRTLMTILTAYDDQLDVHVGRVIDAHLCYGVRHSGDEPDSINSSIPNFQAMFPYNDECKKVYPIENSDRFEHVQSRHWTNATELGADVDNYCARIPQLSSKTASIDIQATRFMSIVTAGHDQARGLCKAIFDRIEVLRSTKSTRPMKELALKDLVRELKRQGYSPSKWSTPSEMKLMSKLGELPCWILSSSSDLGVINVASTLKSCDAYAQRCLSEVQRLRGDVLLTECQDLSTRQIETLLNISESGILLLLQQRCALYSAIQERHRLLSVIKAVDCDEKLIPGGQTELLLMISSWNRKYTLVSERLMQTLVYLNSLTHMILDKDKTRCLQSFIQKFEMDMQEFTFGSNKESFLVTKQALESLRGKYDNLSSLSSSLQKLRKDFTGIIPLDAIDKGLISCYECLAFLQDLFNFQYHPSFSKPDAVRAYVRNVSKTVEAILLSVQAWARPETCGATEATETIWDCHKSLLKTWTALDFHRITCSFSKVLTGLRDIYDGDLEDSLQITCSRLASDLFVLTDLSLASADRLLEESLSFHREASKLQYIILRVFRVLVSKGFCSGRIGDSARDNDICDGKGATFEERDGTGMGEGDGIQDVTDQLTSEEQLLGLQSDISDAKQNDEAKQLGEQEAEQGMEMEANFEGDAYDLPDEHDNKSDDEVNEADKEDLDREMSEEAGLNDQVVDEKMWDDKEDSDKDISANEKFEDNSASHGNGATDEIMTKDDNLSDTGDGAHDKPFESKQENDETIADTDRINDDKTDNFEDSHGIQFSLDDQSPDECSNGDDCRMDLDDLISIGGDDDDSNCEQEDNPVDVTPETDVRQDLSDDISPEVDNLFQDEMSCDSKENAADNELTKETGAIVEDVSDPVVEGMEEDEEPEPQLKSMRDFECKPGLGVRSKDGKDSLDAQGLERSDIITDDDADIIDEADTPSDTNDRNSDGGGHSDGSGRQGNSVSLGSDGVSDGGETIKIPNPLRSPGDASKFWHRKLNVIRNAEDEGFDSADTTGPQNDPGSGKGEFEHTKEPGDDVTQVLGEVDEQDDSHFETKQAQELNRDNPSDSQLNNDHEVKKSGSQPKAPDSKIRRKAIDCVLTNLDDDNERSSGCSNGGSMDVDVDSEIEGISEVDDCDCEEIQKAKNVVVSDLAQLQLSSEHIDEHPNDIVFDECQVDDFKGDIDAVRRAHAKWALLQSETFYLSQRLCEKLRLVMEPLVASKLRGDYRTGKRIHMKRVIAYIASGYRRDKIWLRRTKPAKRNYRVLVAVDDSESMHKSGAGEMALRAMATLAMGMSHLEIGEIGLASFGDEMHILHPFDRPFTSDCGPNLIRRLTFDQKRTRTALCVESTLRALDTPGDHASLQLVFLVSDGRIERDSRMLLRRLLRELLERNILLAMIIVEGADRKDSILNMKEVTFQKGTPVVKRFIDEYPFPYYIILNDMQALPEVLGDALREWFEMIARMQGNSS